MSKAKFETLKYVKDAAKVYMDHHEQEHSTSDIGICTVRWSNYNAAHNVIANPSLETLNNTRFFF